MVVKSPARPGTIPVVVSSSDPLSRAGVTSQLRGCQDFAIVLEDETPLDSASVVLVVADDVDNPTLATIRSFRVRGLSNILLLSGRIDDRGLLAAVEAGVTGVLRRIEATPQNLAAAIRALSANEGTLPPDLLGRLLGQVGKLQRTVLNPRGLTFAGMSEREISVLKLLAEGMDTTEVGRRLFYSDRTVKNIIHDVTSRLELRNRTHAVAHAIKEGLI